MKLYYNYIPATNEQLTTNLKEISSHFSDVIIVCVGTAIHQAHQFDFDNIGPLIGSMLKRLNVTKVYGTLECPVHYQNLKTCKKVLESLYPDAFILAVDAAAGFRKNIIYYNTAPLKAASALKEPIIIGNHSLTITTTRGSSYEKCFNNQISTNEMLRTSVEVCKILTKVK